MNLPIVVAFTGGSGAVYGLRLLEMLLSQRIPIQFSMSPAAFTVLREEVGLTLDADRFSLDALFTKRPEWWQHLSTEVAAEDIDQIAYYHYKNFMAPLASGSALTRGMVICPCSGGTLSGIAHAASSNLIVRAADVHLKERRKLILVPRETPVSSLQLQNYLQVSQAGAVVLPAMPGWYHRVESPMDLVDFVVARILDQLGVSHQLTRRWGEA